MKWLLKWFVGAVALYATVYLGQMLGLGLGLTGVTGIFAAVLALALVNTFVRPAAQLLALPVSCLTLGLFRFVVNALLFWLVGSLGIGLVVKGFIPALFGSVALSAIYGALDTLIVEPAGRKE